MKVIDKREVKKGEKTYSVGDWFEYNNPEYPDLKLCQLIYTGRGTMGITKDHDSFCGGLIEQPELITRHHLNRLSGYVGKKVNVEIHIVSDAE